MTAAILQSNYIPWKGYFDIINTADVFIFYDHVQYTKNDWRNRNRIKTPQGSNWLTIPVRQLDSSQKIEETHVLNQDWRKKHWASLSNFYGKTPGFKLYKDLIEPLYLNSEEFIKRLRFDRRQDPESGRPMSESGRGYVSFRPCSERLSGCAAV